MSRSRSLAPLALSLALAGPSHAWLLGQLPALAARGEAAAEVAEVAFPRQAVLDAAEDFMDQHQLRGLAVGVVARGEVVHEHSHGEFRDYQRLDLASVSKPVTAVLAMKLAEMGRLDLDAPVRDLVVEEDLDRRLTARHLLTHTSGLPHYGERFPFAQRFALTQFRGLRVADRPGTSWTYSSPAYYLLSRALERSQVTRQALHDPHYRAPDLFELVNVHVAEPLGLEAFGRHAVHGHRLGAGGVTASVSTMTGLIRALLRRELLDEASYAAMWRPVAGRDGVVNQGLGWFVGHRPARTVTHTGAHPDLGNFSRIELAVDEGHGVFLMGSGAGSFPTRRLRDRIYQAMHEAGYSPVLPRHR